MEDAIHAMEPPALGDGEKSEIILYPTRRRLSGRLDPVATGPQCCLPLSITTCTSCRPRSEQREGGGGPCC
jgi:hypothetical protein